MSRRSAILVEIVARLDAVGKPADVTVHRSRTRPIDKDALPAMVVYLLEETTESRSSGRHKARRRSKVRVECRVAVAADDETTLPDDAVDPLLSWAVRSLLADPTLGGLAIEVIEESTTWDAEESDRVYAAAAVDFTVDYITAAGDPDVP